MPKLKNLIQVMGFKGKAKHYAYEVVGYDIGNGQKAFLADWKHPAMVLEGISSGLVDGYREFVKEGDFCIDIGAHCGDTTVPMGIAAGKAGCVLALEPNPYVYHVLEKSIRANSGLVNIKTIMAAAGAQEGFMEFEYSDPGFCNGGRHEGISALKHGHAYKLEVFAVNLQNELRSDFAEYLPKLSFIKTDAEGYDLYVLRSIEEIIREFRPVVKTEIFKKTSKQYRADVLEFFRQMNYTVRRVVEEPLVAGDELTTENLAAGTHYDIIALPN
ncbi:hypothetical protein PDESU_04174 [Pontiella desulfatans]|uniref:Methyltransferase FkbM domain-containing protein n=1 Tax=Pontiella desulfatans TaxID=2750659 RepID=A0A6C2U6W2_PONDE|nr:FkbM family methyltransferase [Pontiella desulfatans]VGO15589.1 hypothetical protein PDESU_04174 [Pontiella desulfatans]